MPETVGNGDKQTWDFLKRWGKLLLFILTIGGAIAILRDDVTRLKTSSEVHESRLDVLERQAARDEEWKSSVKQSLERIERNLERKR